jgi:hypothetical protein
MFLLATIYKESVVVRSFIVVAVRKIGTDWTLYTVLLCIPQSFRSNITMKYTFVIPFRSEPVGSLQ